MLPIGLAGLTGDLSSLDKNRLSEYLEKKVSALSVANKSDLFLSLFERLSAEDMTLIILQMLWENPGREIKIASGKIVNLS